ncbi:hypothetical protein BU24DRAFT_444131 [Aaosphaeria arxii CBS 175.79]|uniref:RNA-dependent RNA polymerase n=1 Tax=Aaosphaeria arxii CBS 175.79 TaxID=1450172 RepID=A0A6A5XCU6_9PLEO|nr:uncharacterized protein BU24DRAFT_444131 [Aaosphaeria arxii CBS 175.79]KAF2010935.1 hypothetical protein BU24DRAFT_444131 [Aaosphaeria arxii CBS 175.79]
MRRSISLAAGGQADSNNPAPVPRTPRHPRPGTALHELILSLEKDWQLGLDTNEIRSPETRASDRASKISKKITFLYWQDHDLLTKKLDEFKACAHLLSASSRLAILDELLPQQGTPQSKRTASRLATVTCEASPHVQRRTSLATRLATSTLQNAHTDEVVIEDGSTTEEDEDFQTPPSPTTTARSTQRRLVEGPRRLERPSGKRSSDSSNNDSPSPKLIRRSKGEGMSLVQPKQSRKTLKKHLNYASMLPQQPYSDKETPATSFDTSTQPTTAATSFNTEAPGDSFKFHKHARSSSTSIDSMDFPDIPVLSTKLETEHRRRNGQSIGQSTSTYGSVDETAMLIASDIHQVPSQPRGMQVSSNPPGRAFRSPRKISHHVRDIPHKNLFNDIEEGGGDFPFFILFICCRIANQHNIGMNVVTQCIDKYASNTHQSFAENMRLHPICPVEHLQEPKEVWSANDRNFDGYTFKGRVNFNKLQTEPIYTLELLPIQADKSCRFQRAFGADRFLYLDIIAYESRPDRAELKSGDEDLIQKQWIEWYNNEHTFLGRKWRAFHVEAIKRNKGTRINDALKYDRRVVLFATEGLGIKTPCSIGHLLNWFFPFRINQEQSYLKAHARFDLGLSRTTPTFTFIPSQVEYVPDILADGTVEESRFDDQTLKWRPVVKQEVMNDGCSVMSVGAAKAIWQLYKKTTGTRDPLPSAFQGRIGGAKGLWMISAESYTRDPDHLKIRIEINESQLKFKPHADDYFDEQYDVRRLSFDLVNYSSPPVASDLHISFIPILVDRGVSPKVIAKLMKERLDVERQHLLDILHDPVKLYEWLHKQGPRDREEHVSWQAALPQSLSEKVRYLLETGFSPVESPYLARCLKRVIEKQQLLQEKKLRTPLGRATFVYGVADLYGILAPGQMHLQFSSAFVDQMTDESYQGLDQMDVLVARQPACRRSDIQKIQACIHPGLSHLLDIAVFPSKGQYPLAGKLQGGDYDGDIFWVCWETALVSDFQNAQAPVESPDPNAYQIKRDRRKVEDVMSTTDLSTVDGFLKEALAFRTNPSMLGLATNYLEKQAYLENRVWSKKIDYLCDIHDLLVDSSKQGFVFTKSDFAKVKSAIGLPADLPIPAYKQAMEACDTAKDMGESDTLRRKKFPHNRDNVIDFLYFGVVRDHNIETLDQVSNELSKGAETVDPSLQYPFHYLYQQNSKIVRDELNGLTKRFEDVLNHWNRNMGKGVRSRNYNKVVEECYEKYSRILPVEKDHPDIKPLLMPYLHKKFSMWECIKASALYTKYPSDKKAPFVFHMAGRELATLKVQSRPGTRALIREIHANIKPRPIRSSIQTGESSDSDDDEFTTAFEHPADWEAALGNDF